MTKLVNVFLGLIKLQIYKLKLWRITNTSSSLGKLSLQNISTSKKSNISTGRTVPKKPTLNTAMIQVRQSYKSRQNKRKKN